MTSSDRGRAVAQAPHELVDSRGIFQLTQWRRYVSMAAADAYPRALGLCPFGFELTGDRHFLTRNLRRYYTYVSVSEDAAIAADLLGERACHRLLEILRQETPVFHASIGHVIHPRGRFAASPGGARLLHLQAFTQSGPILQAYARYVLATPNAILDGSLREIQEFDVYEGARRYLFQLALMLASVYPEVAGPATARFAELSHVVAMLARLPVTHEHVRIPATPEETELLEAVVTPFAEKIQEYCTSGGGRAKPLVFQAVDIHSGRPLTGQVREPVFTRKVRLVSRLYEEYPENAALVRRTVT